MLTQKADLFASEMIHLDLHERPYFWIETSLQNLVQPPDAATWCQIVRTCLHNCLLIAVQALEGGICVELGITYTGRGHPKAEYTLWAPLCNCILCAPILLFQLRVLFHLLKVSSRTSTSHQDVLHGCNAFSPKVSPKGPCEHCEGEHHDPSEKASLMSCLRNCTKRPWCHCFEPPTPECTLSCGTPPSPSPSTPGPTTTSSLSCTSTSFIIAVVNCTLSWGQSPPLQCFKCTLFTISSSRTALFCPGRCAVISAQEQSPFLMSVKKAAAACPPPFLIVFSCEMGPREEELWTQITPTRRNTQIHKYTNIQRDKYTNTWHTWTMDKNANFRWILDSYHTLISSITQPIPHK